MTIVAYSHSHEALVQLGRAYRALDHHTPDSPWDATLLVTPELHLLWACPVLGAPAEDEQPQAEWHVIAEAGELDYPPARPEEEAWAALLAEFPVPAGENAERQARLLGRTPEEAHREDLRRRYLGESHIGGLKRNVGDVQFSPLVRDWAVTARELAVFLDAHRPPRLTAEQRVMAQGVRRARLVAELEAATASLGHLMRNAAQSQNGTLRRGFKADLTRWSAVSRPTVDQWLTDPDTTTTTGTTTTTTGETR
ncbi:hypothetical protein [Streptomyces sp. NPDC088557]|uniref:hypothetical protein n=1 Tax=Streptomyces sp. NPDC088557 TaxID=3365867 RepID=UPI00380674AF